MSRHIRFVILKCLSFLHCYRSMCTNFSKITWTFKFKWWKWKNNCFPLRTQLECMSSGRTWVCSLFKNFVRKIICHKSKFIFHVQASSLENWCNPHISIHNRVATCGTISMWRKMNENNLKSMSIVERIYYLFHIGIHFHSLSFQSTKE